MYEGLDLDPGHLAVHGRDLVERQLTGRHDARETDRMQETGLLGRAYVALGRGMEVYWRNVGAQQTHVLNDQRVDADAPQVADKALHVGHLVVIDYGVDRGIDLDAVWMCRLDHPPDVVEAVGGGTARTVAGRTDVYGISPASMALMAMSASRAGARSSSGVGVMIYVPVNVS